MARAASVRTGALRAGAPSPRVGRHPRPRAPVLVVPGNGANAEDPRITWPATSGEGCGGGSVTRTESPAMRRAMARSRFNDPIEPMTLSNMRENGVRSLAVQCHHETIINADHWPGDMQIPLFVPRMVCTKCGIVGADARPNWRERER
jgi:hypothetical protein